MTTRRAMQQSVQRGQVPICKAYLLTVWAELQVRLLAQAVAPSLRWALLASLVMGWVWLVQALSYMHDSR